MGGGAKATMGIRNPTPLYLHPTKRRIFIYFLSLQRQNISFQKICFLFAPHQFSTQNTWGGGFATPHPLTHPLQTKVMPIIIRMRCDIINLLYTGCPRRNVRDFGRVFLMLNYTDITQNTYVQSRTVTEIMAREKCGRHRCRHTVGRP